ncbi:MAG: hypothetical protein HPAVJP_1410 [Candidatus Hepatoplasma vulgare]|nr:MAG: hypothetical protein HPAVJP_1410 [Candidatus Hepatoplasma sp.]
MNENDIKKLILKLKKHLIFDKQEIKILEQFTKTGNLLKFIQYKVINENLADGNFKSYYFSNKDWIEKEILKKSDNYWSFVKGESYSFVDISSTLFFFLLKPIFLNFKSKNRKVSIIFIDEKIYKKLGNYESIMFSKELFLENIIEKDLNKFKEKNCDFALFIYKKVKDKSYFKFIDYFLFEKEDSNNFYFKINKKSIEPLDFEEINKLKNKSKISLSFVEEKSKIIRETVNNNIDSFHKKIIEKLKDSKENKEINFSEINNMIKKEGESIKEILENYFKNLVNQNSNELNIEGKLKDIIQKFNNKLTEIFEKKETSEISNINLLEEKINDLKEKIDEELNERFFESINVEGIIELNKKELVNQIDNLKIDIKSEREDFSKTLDLKLQKFFEKILKSEEINSTFDINDIKKQIKFENEKLQQIFDKKFEKYVENVQKNNTSIVSFELKNLKDQINFRQKEFEKTLTSSFENIIQNQEKIGSLKYELESFINRILIDQKNLEENILKKMENKISEINDKNLIQPQFIDNNESDILIKEIEKIKIFIEENKNILENRLDLRFNEFITNKEIENDKSYKKTIEEFKKLIQNESKYLEEKILNLVNKNLNINDLNNKFKEETEKINNLLEKKLEEKFSEILLNSDQNASASIKVLRDQIQEENRRIKSEIKNAINSKFSKINNKDNLNIKKEISSIRNEIQKDQRRLEKNIRDLFNKEINAINSSKDTKNIKLELENLANQVRNEQAKLEKILEGKLSEKLEELISNDFEKKETLNYELESLKEEIINQKENIKNIFEEKLNIKIDEIVKSNEVFAAIDLENIKKELILENEKIQKNIEKKIEEQFLNLNQKTNDEESFKKWNEIKKQIENEHLILEEKFSKKIEWTFSKR